MKIRLNTVGKNLYWEPMLFLKNISYVFAVAYSIYISVQAVSLFI